MTEREPGIAPGDQFPTWYEVSMGSSAMFAVRAVTEFHAKAKTYVWYLNNPKFEPKPMLPWVLDAEQIKPDEAENLEATAGMHPDVRLMGCSHDLPIPPVIKQVPRYTGRGTIVSGPHAK
jgi:hypothetical protein